MARRAKAQNITFEQQLLLSRYLLAQIGMESLQQVADTLNRTEWEAVNEESGNSMFFEFIAQRPGCLLSREQLRLYDENILRHTRQIGERRGGIRWKYFQYIALLLTELYLDRFTQDRQALADDIHRWATLNCPLVDIGEFDADKMNKLAYMCATGSGKTLLLHVNLLQFQHYADRLPEPMANTILLTPNENMSRQHLAELELSSIPAHLFSKAEAGMRHKGEVSIIDINKLDEVGKEKTVSVDSFESRNLLLVDEGHRGLKGEKWTDYRRRMAEDGFTFEYSATFKQALNTGSTKKDDREAVREYGKSIAIDYSYKWFYNDGYGKDYRIYNLQQSLQNDEHRELYLTGCLLTFYQQVKYSQVYNTQLRLYNIENPLMVFVGNRVTASTTKEDLTDVQEVVMFLSRFIKNRQHTAANIDRVLKGQTGVVNRRGDDIFASCFNALVDMNGGYRPDGKEVYDDVMRMVFRCSPNADEPRLHLEEITRADGEIAMRVGSDGEWFGLISVGDTAGLRKTFDKPDNDVVVGTNPFLDEGFFASINKKDSPINILIGSRKFSEGWNSWRVSTMGLINFAKGEGSQAIQLFGRGVRLKGYNGTLKRSSALTGINPPKHINVVETLTIFGVKAQYMEDFKRFLEMEGAPSGEVLWQMTLEARSRFPEVRDRHLKVMRLKEGCDFKRQSRRLRLDLPDEGFMHYLLNNKTVVDCRSKVASIESTVNGNLQIEPEEHTFTPDRLAILDWNRIYDSLQRYKNEKNYYNISIEREKLRDILAQGGWYTLLIPWRSMRPENMQELRLLDEVALMTLKSYMDKYYRYEKQRWENPRMEYADLQEDDNNFVTAYNIDYTQTEDNDTTGTELEHIILQFNEMQRYDTCKQMKLFDFRNHLYFPLISLARGNMQIRISPVALNDGETRFVERMKDFVTSHSGWLSNKALFLLRNKSKVGMGFFEACNFYPDFILWIDTPEVQYISFIDPKGLMMVPAHDPKVQFFKTIKQKEAEMMPPDGEKRIVLNSFLMSETSSADLRDRWGKSIEEREAMNVFTLDDDRCIEKMMEKICN